MDSISKKEQFCQVKQGIKRDNGYLLIGLDVSKKSSTACFYNIEKNIILKKYSVSHDLEGFQRFVCKIEQIMETNNFRDVIIGVEPTANYHKPISEYLRNKNYFMVYVSSVAAKSNRKTIDGGRWGKNDPRDAYNVVDLMRQGKILYYRDENTQSMNIRKYLLLRQRLIKTKNSLKTRIRNNIWACYFPELCPLFKNLECPDVLTLLEHGLSSQTIKNMDYPSFAHLFCDTFKPNSKRYLLLYHLWQSAKTSIGLPMPSSALQGLILKQ
ncbi:MAG: transposase [Elusimicrobiota bacterium]